MSLFQIRTLANRMKSRANKRPINSRAEFLSRTLVATILAASFLTSVAPLVRSAAFHPCKMACCVGKQTHAEGSCSSGLVASRSKPRLRVEGEIFCGLKTARERHTASTVKAAPIRQVDDSNHCTHAARPKGVANTDSYRSSVHALTAPCSPDCSACEASSARQPRPQSTLSFTSKPGLTCEFSSITRSQIASTLRAQYSQLQPRAPPSAL